MVQLAKPDKQIKSYTGYKTTDGKTHETHKEAVSHQRLINFRTALLELLEGANGIPGGQNRKDAIEFIEGHAEQLSSLLNYLRGVATI